MNLIEALHTLDSETDEHWVDDQPSLSLLSELTGGPVTAEDLAALDLLLARPAPGAQLNLPAPPVESTPEVESFDVSPEPEPEEVVVIMDEDDGDERLVKMRALEDERADLQSKVAEIELTLVDLSKERDALTARIDKLIEDAEDSEIPGHIRTQMELKRIRDRGHQAAAERIARRRAALALVDPKDLDPRSPVDAAMARRKSRGAARPKR